MASTSLCLPTAPNFSGYNYDFWAIKMQHCLIASDLWDIVDMGFQAPVVDAQLTEEQQKISKENSSKDARALFILQSAVSDKIFPSIMNATIAKEAWAILQQENQSIIDQVLAQDIEENKKENEQEINEVDATKGDEINKVDATKPVGDDDCNKWWQSTKQTLLMNSVGGELGLIDPFSISIVPDELRKGNENAYKPKILAMGPTYNGAGRHLLELEDFKRMHLSILQLRSEGRVYDIAATPEQGGLAEFSKIIWRNDESVWSFYTEEISLDRNKLATTMLCDCWLMLLLLISGSYESKKGLISHTEYLTMTPVRKMEEALTDLLLLENQIPLALVIVLSQKLFPEQFGHDESSTTLNFKDMALSLLSCSSPHGYSNNSNINTPSQFLSLVYSSIFLGRDDDDDNEEVKPKPEENNDQCLSLPMAEKNEEERVDGGLNRCATKLHAAGITLKPPDDQRENTKKPSPKISSFNFDIRFRNGTLEIPQLHITEATEPLWRNFIAWEHESKKWFSNFWRNAPEELVTKTGGVDTLRCKCTSAALLFNGLICCSSDVQLLKDKPVIVDHLNMSNRDLVPFFRSITMGVDRGIIVDYSSHNKIVAALNKYSASNKATEIPTIEWHYLMKILEDLFYSLSKFFWRRYNFAVTFGLVIGVVQTIYSVLSYHQKK